MLVMDQIALGRACLVGSAVGLTLTSPVTDLKKKTMQYLQVDAHVSRPWGEGPV